MNAPLSQAVLNDLVLSQFYYFEEDIKVTDTFAGRCSCECELTLDENIIQIEMTLAGEVTHVSLYIDDADAVAVDINEENWLCQFAFEQVQAKQPHAFSVHAYESKAHASADNVAMF